MHTDRRRALAALTGAGVLFGLTVPLSKIALGWLDPTWLALARFAIVAPLLALAVRHSMRASFSPAVVGWGALGYGVMMVLQNVGIERTSVTHAALIYGAVPALVALMSAATGRATIPPAAWAGFAAALAGVALVTGAGGEASLSGDLLVLASAALNAMFVVAQGDLLVGRDPIAVTAWQMGAATVVTGVCALGAHVPAAPTGGQLGATAALVVLGSLLPFVLYAYGQARVEPAVAGAFINLEPLVGAASGIAVFGNAFGLAQALGAAAIVAGLVLGTKPPRKRYESSRPRSVAMTRKVLWGRRAATA